MPYWTGAFHTASHMWSLQPSYQVDAIFIPPPFPRWGSWHSRTLHSTAGEKTSWNLSTSVWSLYPNPSITPPCLPPLLCGNPFCSLLVRMCLVSGDRNSIQISWTTTVLEGHRDHDWEGKRSASPQGWGELRKLQDVRISSFLCASLRCGYILSWYRGLPPHSHPPGRGVVIMTSNISFSYHRRVNASLPWDAVWKILEKDFYWPGMD